MIVGNAKLNGWCQLTATHSMQGLSCLLMLVGLSIGADLVRAAEIKGKVTEVKDLTVKITSDSDLVPKVGDKVEIVFAIPGIDDVAHVAEAKVTEVGGDFILAKIESRKGKVAKNQTARMFSDNPQKRSPWKSLFNGKDLTGWTGLDGFWTVKDGVISGAETKEQLAPQTFLIYQDAMFSDFELHFKYKFATPSGNSGVQIRSKVYNEKQHQVGGYQADFDAGRGYDGSIYDEAGIAGWRGTISNRGEKTTWDAGNNRHNEKLTESSAELKDIIKHGDWNDVVIVAKGNHVTYAINGHLMTDLTDDSPKALKEGVIALQLHAGFAMEVQFKGIEIKDLSASKSSGAK